MHSYTCGKAQTISDACIKNLPPEQNLMAESFYFFIAYLTGSSLFVATSHINFNILLKCTINNVINLI